jgi:ribosomal protein S18 acetylase RimI-like enzyme
VNGRVVGRIRVATDPRRGPATGRLDGPWIDDPDRRRGRAAVAVLGAEEVLRGWECRRVEATVPADAPIALRLLDSLGYGERNRAMAKPLTGPPPVPPGRRELRPMDDADFAAWKRRAIDGYAGNWVRWDVPYDWAARLGKEDFARILPDGPRTASTALRVLSDRGEDVGWLWLRLRDPADPAAPAWVFLVEVDAARRGRGHGRALMLAAEREALAAGARTLGLNVFADNTAALRLYESLSYRPTSYEVTKPLL